MEDHCRQMVNGVVDTGEIKWLRGEINRGSVSAMVTLGNKLGVCEESVELYRTAADCGSTEARFNLANCLFTGAGVKQDKVDAVAHQIIAAEAGNSDAQMSLGCYYQYGEGVPVDPVEAVKWYYHSAIQNNALAQNSLGHCFYFGIGTTADCKAALMWYLKGAEQKLSDAQFNAGAMLLQDREDQYGIEFPRDPQSAIRYFKAAAAQKHPAALYQLAVCYSNGRDLAVDHKVALSYYKDSAMFGYSKAVLHH
jgi:TPR repeat protein